MEQKGSGRILSDKPEPDRRMRRGGGERLEGEYEDQRILVNTPWHALQLMREARGQLLTTQR